MSENAFMDEPTLVTGIKNGDKDVLRSLYVAYYPMVRKLVLDNSGSEAEARDVYQEAMIVLYENIRKSGFRLTCKVKTYLYSISRNIWLKQLNRKLPTSDLDDSERFVDVNRDFEKHEEKEAQLAKVRASLDELGEPCYSILTYFFFQRLTMEEIAGKLNYTNAANAKNQKYKCFKRLKAKVLKAR